MTNTLGGTYKTGTVSVEDGSTTVVGVGTFWAPIVVEGDLIQMGDKFGYVDSVTDSLHLELQLPWVGDLEDVPYVIMKTSWQRYEPAITQKKVRDLIAHYTGLGVLIGVEGDEPDPELGEDGWQALKTNAGAWKMWRMIGGVWVYQGTSAGITPRGIWDSGEDYLINDVVSRLGVLYIAFDLSTNVAPETSSTPGDSGRKWDILLQGGNLYDIMFDVPARPGSDEEFGKVTFSRAVSIPAGMADSVAQADIAATASTVFSLKKKPAASSTYTEFATLTFAAAGKVGVFAAATDTSFAKGDNLIIVAPSVRDATLADISFTIAAFR